MIVNNYLKQRFLLIAYLLFMVLASNCRDYPGRPEYPPLNEFLCKEYKRLTAYVTEPNANSGQMVSALETSFLKLNTDRSFRMQVDVYHPILDTTYSISQHGIYHLTNTYFSEAEEWLAADAWKGWIHFEPVGNSGWEADFSASSYGFLSFGDDPAFSLGEGNGYLRIAYWGD